METAASVLSGVSTLIVFLGVFLPEIAILAGFLSDLLNLQVRHIPTSAFGILAAILNWVVAWLFSFFGGPTPTVSSFGSAWNWASTSIGSTGTGGSSSSSGGLGAQAAAISNMLNARVTRLGVGAPVPPPSSGRGSGGRNVVQQAAAAAAPVMAAAAPGPIPQLPAGTNGTPQDPLDISNDPDGDTPGAAGSSGAASTIFNIFTAPRAPASGTGGATDVSYFRPNQSVYDERAAAAGVNQLKNLRNVPVSSVSQAAPLSPGSPGGRVRRSQAGGARLAEFVDDKFNPCAVRGLGFFNVTTRPMGIAVLTTIFFVYLLDMTVNKKRTRSEQTAYWLVAMGILGLNTYSYYKLGCIDSFFSVFTPLCVGLFVGGMAFWIYQSAGKDYLPMDPETGPVTGEYSKCASSDGGGDFVCDAYLNGERIGTVAS
jgi:hypothetical protein